MKLNTKEISAQYMDHMGSDLSVVNAARTSFSKESWWLDPHAKTLKPDDIGLIKFLASGFRTKEWSAFLDEILSVSQFYDREKAKERLTILLRAYKRKAQHWAPFGHPHVQIRVNMPIFLARQFVKHQVGGVWSEESRRYIDSIPDYWFPDEFHSRPSDIKQGSGELVQHQIYAEDQAYHATETSLQAYVNLRNATVAPEEARIILTLNTMTTVVWTGSLLFWSRVVNQRVDDHAQLAAQILGQKISEIVGPIYPHSWKELTT